MKKTEKYGSDYLDNQGIKRSSEGLPASINYTDQFIALILNKISVPIPEEILDEVKTCLIDYLGVYCAGLVSAFPKIKDLLINLGDPGLTPVIGTDLKASKSASGFVYGYASHVLELDDGNRFSMLHVEATIFSAIFAEILSSNNLNKIGADQPEEIQVEMDEIETDQIKVNPVEAHLIDADKIKADQIKTNKLEVNSDRFIKAVLAGYEATARLAQMIQPSHKLKGFHASGTCGAVGAAVAVGVLRNLNEEQIKNSISAACTMASGLLAAIDDDSQLKPVNIAHAVSTGILAASLGQSGFKGPDDVLMGKRGFLKSFCDDIHLDVILDLAKDKYAISEKYLKPYAACRHCHAPVEAMLRLTENNNLVLPKQLGIENCKNDVCVCNDRYSNIEKITIRTYKLAVDGHDHTIIDNISSAKMSIPFCVALALHNGSCSFTDFTDEICSDPALLETAKKIEVLADEEWTRLSPGIRGADIEMRFFDGRRICQKVKYPLGEPENPMSSDDVLNKYYSLMNYAGVSGFMQDSLINAVNAVDHEITPLIQLLKKLAVSISED